MKRTTLIPMDFTTISINALKFAMGCFPDDNFEIVHVRKHSLDVNDPVPIGAMETTIEFWHNTLTLFITKEMEWSSWPENIKLSCIEGMVVPKIIKHAKEVGAHQIVMGTRDQYDYLDKWLGTTSLGVVRKSDLPVYLVPRYARGKNMNRVLVASDHHLKDQHVVRSIANWNDEFGAYLHFIHIADTETESYAEEQKAIVQNLFEQRNVTFGFEVSVLTDSDIPRSLLGNAYSLHVDLMLILPNKHSYIESLLFRSVSKELILRSEIPLLFMPT